MDDLMMIWWPKLVANKVNKILFCLTETNLLLSLKLIDLFWPRLIVSSDAFQDFFVHLIYNSALFLASCYLFILVTCRSQFDLSSVGSAFRSPKFLHSYVITKGVLRCSSEKFRLDWCLFLIYFCLRIQISLPYSRKGRVSALCTSALENF